MSLKPVLGKRLAATTTVLAALAFMTPYSGTAAAETAPAATPVQPWLNPALDPDARAALVVSAMTQDE